MPEDQYSEKLVEPIYLTIEEAKREFNFQIKQYIQIQDYYSKAKVQIAKVIKQIERIVKGRLLVVVYTQTNIYKKTSVYIFIIVLKRMFIPFIESVKSAFREEYNYLLSRARYRGVNPKKQIDKQIEVYSRATAYRIPKVTSSFIVRNFLNVVRVYIAPNQVSSKLYNIVRDKLNSI